MDEAQIGVRIEDLVGEEQQLRRAHAGRRLSADEQARLEAVGAELDRCWDALRRRRAGAGERLSDADVPAPPNDLEGPEPEPPHLEHGVHDDRPAPDPGVNPNVP